MSSHGHVMVMSWCCQSMRGQSAAWHAEQGLVLGGECDATDALQVRLLAIRQGEPHALQEARAEQEQHHARPLVADAHPFPWRHKNNVLQTRIIAGSNPAVRKTSILRVIC